MHTLPVPVIHYYPTLFLLASKIPQELTINGVKALTATLKTDKRANVQGSCDAPPDTPASTASFYVALQQVDSSQERFKNGERLGNVFKMVDIWIKDLIIYCSIMLMYND